MDSAPQKSKQTKKKSGDIWGSLQVIEDLQLKAQTVLDRLIEPRSSVAMLDYPNNSNVGDSLIWLGEMTYLAARSITPQYTCDVRNYSRDRLREVVNSGAIILQHGGGNFGTLWPEEQQFRLRVLTDFPGVKIIQFAQSIHFDNQDAIDETAKAIRAHGNYTFLARDKPTFDFASEHFDCEVLLCPDMAFFIGAIPQSSKPYFDRFILSRTDHEKIKNWLIDLSTLKGNRTVDAKDWLHASWYERFVSRIEMHTVAFRKVIDPYNKGLLLIWNHLAQLRLRRGKRLLERGRVIISDRLHVHILCILLNKPHALMDNTSKKISSLNQTWTKSFRGVVFVDDLKGALEAADQFDASESINA